MWQLNAVNFFLAQIAAVVVPFLNVYLHQHEWRYDTIGFALATAGAGSLMFQIPAGIVCDWSRRPRALLISASIVLGLCYFLMPPLVGAVNVIFILLFASGIAGTFFGPLLATLALAFAGLKNFPRVTGQNHMWSHCGGLMAAGLTLLVVPSFGIRPLFFIAAGFAFLAALFTAIVPVEKLTHLGERKIRPVKKFTRVEIATVLQKLFGNRAVLVLFISLALFHLANTSIMGVVSLYLKHIGGSDTQVAWLVVVAQPVMIVSSWLAGKFGAHRKPLLVAGMALLPVRIVLYPLVHHPLGVLIITALDGITSGVVAVLVVVISGDLTAKLGRFNSLMGILFTVPALGAVIGGVLQGVLLQQLGFNATFATFALIATLAAFTAFVFMPETNQSPGSVAAPPTT